MKQLITLTLVLFLLNSEAKDKIILPIDSLTGKVTFDTIILVPSKSKDILQLEVTQWIALTYRSANDVIQLNDKESGVIIVKGIFKNIKFPGLGGERDVFHTLTIKIKDGKIKITLTDFANDYGIKGAKNIEDELTASGWTSTMTPKQQINFQVSLKQRVDLFFESIYKKLNNKSEEW